MTRQRRETSCPRDPIGLSSQEAAAFLGISEGTFQKAVDNGLMPVAYEIFGRNIWYVNELESALRRLPRKAPQQERKPDDDLWKIRQ